MYACIMYVYYTLVLVSSDPLRKLPWKPQLVVSVIYQRIRETEFCVLASPAIW
jgi:hypothetical protein